MAGCRHSLLHDELSCGQWEAVDRRHRLCVIREEPCAVSASAAADGCQLLSLATYLAACCGDSSLLDVRDGIALAVYSPTHSSENSCAQDITHHI